MASTSTWQASCGARQHAGPERLAAGILMASVLCLGFWQFGFGSGVPARAWVAQELMQRDWQKTASANTAPAQREWADDRPVARLTAKGGEVELVVLAGGSKRNLALGPGHLGISALPGEKGNSIIAGHRDTHFRFLQYMSVGESIQVELPGGRKHLYQVTDIDVVDARIGSLVLDTDKPVLSLVTGYPFDGGSARGTMRYVVSAELIF